MKIFNSFVFACALFSVSAHASLQSKNNNLNQKDYFVSFSLGQHFAMNNFNKNSEYVKETNRTKTALNALVGFGKSVTSNFDGEIMIGVFNKIKASAKSFTTAFPIFPNGTKESLASSSFNVKSHVAAFTPKYSFRFGDIANIAFSAALGVTRNQSSDYKIQSLSSSDIYILIHNKKNWAPLVSVGMGVNHDVTDRVNLGISYKYFDLGKFKNKKITYHYQNIIADTIPNREIQSRLRVSSVNFEVNIKV